MRKKGTPADEAKSGTVQGEGDYVAGRNYDEAQREFVQSGKVDERAGAAQPQDGAEAGEMADAEREGKSHSKGEAPGDMKQKQRPQRQR
jgi:hypothetical protein